MIDLRVPMHTFRMKKYYVIDVSGFGEMMIKTNMFNTEYALNIMN